MDERDDTELARRARAVERKARMGLAPRELTPDERVELVAELTRAAWAMTGEPWPSLERSRWPVRIRRLGDDVEAP